MLCTVSKSTNESRLQYAPEPTHIYLLQLVYFSSQSSWHIHIKWEAKLPVGTGHRWSRNVPSVETEAQQTAPQSTPNHSLLDESAHDTHALSTWHKTHHQTSTSTTVIENTSSWWAVSQCQQGQAGALQGRGTPITVDLYSARNLKRADPTDLWSLETHLWCPWSQHYVWKIMLRRVIRESDTGIRRQKRRSILSFRN